MTNNKDDRLQLITELQAIAQISSIPNLSEERITKSQIENLNEIVSSSADCSFD